MPVRYAESHLENIRTINISKVVFNFFPRQKFIFEHGSCPKTWLYMKYDVSSSVLIPAREL
jgi:hypothetical protein